MSDGARQQPSATGRARALSSKGETDTMERKMSGNYERALVDMLEALERYTAAFESEFAHPVGDDNVLGMLTQNILFGLRGLLNGPTGQLDRACFDRRILAAAEWAGLLDENGELDGEPTGRRE